MRVFGGASLRICYHEGAIATEGGMCRIMGLGLLILVLALPVFGALAQDAATGPRMQEDPFALGKLLNDAVDAMTTGDCEKGLPLMERVRPVWPEQWLVFMGGFHEQGQCVPRDPQKAFAMVREAAEKYEGIGQPFLGYMYLNGIGTPRDPEKAAHWFEKTAHLLRRVPFDTSVRMLEELLGSRGLPRELRDLLRTSGRAEPLDMAIEAIRDGECEKGLALMERALEQDRPAALVFLAGYYEEGHCVPRDLGRAFSLYREAFEKGEVGAAPLLGLMYLNGLGTPRDADRAADWFRRTGLFLAPFDAREWGINVELILGDRSVPEELKKEIAWFDAVERSDPENVYATALRMRDGVGPAKDCRIAEHWLSKAASQGHVEAQYEYANWLIDGTCVERNESSARNWLKKAARKWHLAAQVRLGRLLMNSDGHRIHKIEAYAWLLIAQTGGAEVADDLEALRSVLDEFDIRNAERWAKKPEILKLSPR